MLKYSNRAVGNLNTVFAILEYYSKVFIFVSVKKIYTIK